MALGNSGLPTSAITTDTSKTPRATMGGGGAAPTINGSSGVARPASVVKPSQANSANQTDTGGATGTRANPGVTPASMSGVTVRQQSQMANPGKGTKDEEYVMPGQNRPTSNASGPSADKLAQVEANYQKMQNPGPSSNYTPSGSSGSAGGSSSPSVDTGYDPYAAENAAAAATTQRITQGVDMSDKINEANNAWQQATQGYGTQADGIVNQLQNSTNANIDQYQGNAQAIIDQLSNLTGQQLADYATQTGQTIDQAVTQINNIIAGMQENMKPAEIGRIGRVDTTEQENILQQMTNNQREQLNQQIDYATNKGVNELQRALEDAAPQFQAQRDQIAANEAQAKDNQALYAEMRGDRGGIGKAQYDAIANTAATNQLTVNKEQTKLSTDTARQIADLRAQGEFDKADKMLEISQEYLGKLMQLKQWADEANIGIDEFNIGVDQWEQEYNAKLQQALGELGIKATQYATDLNLDRQQYLTNQGINAANTEAQNRLGLEQDINSQRQNLDKALAEYGLSNAQYMTNQDVNRLSGILNEYMQNAQNMASTELAAANVTGAFSDATTTLANREAQADRLAQAGAQMLAQGITPTDAQLKALGWSKDQYKGYKDAMEAAQAAAAAAARRGGSSRRASVLVSDVQAMIAGGAPLSEINNHIDNYVGAQLASKSDETAARGLTSGLVEGQNYHVSPQYTS